MALTIGVDITSLIEAIQANTAAVVALATHIDNLIFQEQEITLFDGDGNVVRVNTIGPPVFPNGRPE